MELKVVNATPSLRQAAEALFDCYLDLAEAAFQLGDVDEGDRILSLAVSAAKDFPDRDPRVARALNQLGVLRCRQRNYEEARQFLSRAIAIFEELGAEVARDLSTAHVNLAVVYTSQQDYRQARECLNRALSIAEASLPAGDVHFAWVLEQLGDLTARDGNIAAALRYYHGALSVKQALDPASWDLAVTLNKIGELYFRQERYNEAEPYLIGSLFLRQQILGWRHPGLAGPMTRVALLFSARRQFESAEQFLRYTLALQANSLDANDPAVIANLNELAKVYDHMGRYGLAKSVRELAEKLAAGEQRSIPVDFPPPPRVSADLPETAVPQKVAG